MKNDPVKRYKLMVFIRKMNEKEFKELGLWVHSPFHNTNKKAIKLYDVLKSKYRKTDKEIESLDLMKYMGIIPRSARQKDISPEHQQKLRRVMSDLAAQIEELFLWKKTKEDTVACKYQLMNALAERQYYELLPSVLNKTKKIHKSSSLRNIKYYRNAHYLADMDYEIDIFLDKREFSIGTKSIVSIDALQQFSLCKLLRYYFIIVSTQGIFKVEHDRSLMELIMKYLKNSKDINTFTIHVYYLLLKMMDKKNPNDYYQLKDILFNRLDAFDNVELSDILTAMRNYCVSRMDYIFREEIFSLNLISINRGLLMTNSFFPAQTFATVVHDALSIGKTKWTHSFLEKYGRLLPPNLKDNTLNYCYALYAFHTQNYDDAQEYLNRVPISKDIFQNLGYKILRIKIYYDKNEFNYSNIDIHPIKSELEAIRQYVLSSTNKKMSEYFRQRYSNFANFFKRILNRKKKLIQHGQLSENSIEKLQADLTNLQPLAEAIWVKEKVNELMEEVSRNSKSKN